MPLYFFVRPVSVNSTEAFAMLAGKYCSWAELSVGNLQSDYQSAIRLLPALYTSALELPDLDSDISDIPSCYDSEWKAVYNRFRSMPVGLYPDVIDPTDKSSHSVGYGDLLDDLTDIYRDLSGPLRIYNAGNVDAAVWGWRFSFYSHWGTHLVSALRILHHYRTGDSV